MPQPWYYKLRVSVRNMFFFRYIGLSFKNWSFLIFGSKDGFFSSFFSATCWRGQPVNQWFTVLTNDNLTFFPFGQEKHQSSEEVKPKKEIRYCSTPLPFPSNPSPFYRDSVSFQSPISLQSIDFARTFSGFPLTFFPLSLSLFLIVDVLFFKTIRNFFSFAAEAEIFLICDYKVIGSGFEPRSSSYVMTFWGSQKMLNHSSF